VWTLALRPLAWSRSTSWTAEAAEAKFPIKIDIPVPGSGLGRRLTGMLGWCRENVAAGEGAQHGFLDWKRRDGPIDFTRWHFSSDAWQF
jgi:hypothetical protein